MGWSHVTKVLKQISATSLGFGFANNGFQRGKEAALRRFEMVVGSEPAE